MRAGAGTGRGRPVRAPRGKLRQERGLGGKPRSARRNRPPPPGPGKPGGAGWRRGGGSGSRCWGKGGGGGGAPATPLSPAPLPGPGRASLRASVSQRGRGLGEALAAGEKQPKLSWRASAFSPVAALAEWPGARSKLLALSAGSSAGVAAGPRWFPARCHSSCSSSAGTKPVLGWGGLSGTPSDQEMHGHAGTVSLSQLCSDQGSSPLAAAAG